MGCRFEFVAPSDLVAWDCNCSICSMRRNTHVVVPENHFRLLCGEAMLQEYKVRGNLVQSFL